MAANTTVSFTVADGWTEITVGDVTNITFQVTAGGTVLIQATTGSAPSSDAASLTYKTGQGEANRALSDLFPGVASADRVFAKAVGTDRASVFVSHA